jgi:hypothetical protein
VQGWENGSRVGLRDLLMRYIFQEKIRGGGEYGKRFNRGELYQ